MQRRRPASWTPATMAPRPIAASASVARWSCGGAWRTGAVPVLALLLALCAAALAEAALAPGPTLLRKCCGAHEQLSASLDACVAYEGAAGDARAAWEGAGAVAARAGDAGVPWWLNAATPVFDAQTGAAAATARSLLRAQPPHATLRYGPAPPCARSAFKYFTWNSFSRYRLLSNGTLLLRTDDLPSTSAPNLPLPPDLYCADRVDTAGEDFVFITCPCESTVCVRKCCSLKQELSVGVGRKSLSQKCSPRMSKETWSPLFYPSENSNITSDVEYILLTATTPHCSSSSEIVVLNYEKPAKSIRVLSNGSALMENYGHGAAYPPEAWCADTSLVDGEWRVANALVCVRLEASRTNPVSRVLYGSLFLLSSLCLAATLLVFALLPDLRRSAHAKALLSHAAALLAGSLTLATTQFSGPIDSRNWCYTLAFVIQYSMLATFFWLNAVCFDLAWNFREILPPKACSGRERRKFICYSVYAWGCPAVICAVTAVMDWVEGIPDYFVRPNIGLYNCWFYKLPAQFAYFYGPIAVLLAMNLVLYAHTALQLVIARRDTALVDAAGGGGQTARSALGNPRERAMLHMKLFLLMGVTWVMEVVSVVVGQADAYWYLPDSVNILRGVFVFVLLCCKRSVWRRLRARLRELGCWPCGGGGGGGGGAGGKAVARRGGVRARGGGAGHLGPGAGAVAAEREEEDKRKRCSATSSAGSADSDATRITGLSVRSLDASH